MAQIKVKKRGSSRQYGSGWLKIDVMDFKVGGKLTLGIGGYAESVVIRLLPQGYPPDDPVEIVNGLDGPIFQVPENRIISIILSEDYPNVSQISVHGGAYPWQIYPLGEKNGPASLMSARYEEVELQQ